MSVQNEEHRMECEATLRPLDEMSQRLAAMHDATSDLRRDVNEIKLRLFNGLTDTTRETYAKVLNLESKQNLHEEFMQQCHSEWTNERVSRVRRDRALLVLLWSATIVHLAAIAIIFAMNGMLKALF
jgi:type III secretory pathway component EscR